MGPACLYQAGGWPREVEMGGPCGFWDLPGTVCYLSTQTHRQAAVKGNFQPSLTPPYGVARDGLRVFRVLEIPAWPACSQQGLCAFGRAFCLSVGQPGLREEAKPTTHM